TYLSQVPDPRGLQGRRHQLVAMLATVVCAVLCGARGYAAIAEWLHKWPLDFCHRLGYLRRPPKKGAFRNLLLALDAERFERAIADWMSQTLNVTLTEDDLQGVSIDGKWLRGIAWWCCWRRLITGPVVCSLSIACRKGRTKPRRCSICWSS
ncbi:MAG: transposase family protein, partial [Candidatus Saccharimonas sp.]|nr:transposase family protein [Planctomycetaceae bacterium]